MTQLQLSGGAEQFARKRPVLKIFVNDDDNAIAESRLARCVYAETRASSLAAVESLCVMIKNTRRATEDIADDENVFESLAADSPRHKDLLVYHNDPGFQMCLRAVRKIKTDSIADNISGATRFHRADIMPEWATSIGSIAEVDGLVFYK